MGETDTGATATRFFNCFHSGPGYVQACCFICGGLSKDVQRDSHGEPDLFELPQGWSQAPYPASFQHRDGSIGSTYTCPSCNGKLRAGATLQSHRHSGGGAMRDPHDTVTAEIPGEVAPPPRVKPPTEPQRRAACGYVAARANRGASCCRVCKWTRSTGWKSAGLWCAKHNMKCQLGAVCFDVEVAL